MADGLIIKEQSLLALIGGSNELSWVVLFTTPGMQEEKEERKSAAQSLCHRLDRRWEGGASERVETHTADRPPSHILSSSKNLCSPKGAAEPNKR